MADPVPFSEELFRAAIEGSSSAVLITDKTGTIVYANQAFTDMSGYSADEAIGQNAGFYASGSTTPEVFAEMWAEVSQGKDWRGELQNRRKDGTLYWESLTITPIRNSDGNITHFISLKNDMTARRDAERRLRRNEAQMNTILENVGARIYMIGADFKYQYANREVCEALGKSQEEIVGKSIEDFFSPDIAQALMVNNRTVFEKRETVRTVEQVETVLDEQERYFWAVKVPLFDENDEVYALLGMSTDITERKHLEDKLHYLAMMDGLTGLFNRRHFLELAEKEARRTARYNQKLGFLMIDIDHFKRINDTFGHATGDRALQEFSKVLEHAVREADFVARYGGEEFVVALPETTLPGSGVLAERIRAAVEKIEVKTDDGKIARFTASIGGTHLLSEGDTAEQALSRADKALYEAKKNGRNQAVFH